MKRNKITAVILSIVMSMSLMMPSLEVMADETTAPSETQKTETVETKEPKAAEKQTPKETEKQEPKETEKQESKATETQETKETEKSEPETTETRETKGTESQEPKETETQAPEETEKQDPAKSDETQITETNGSDEKEPTESEDNGDNPEESNETAVVEGKIPSQSASTPKKNAVTGTCGENLTWTFEDGILTISGSGKMSNYTNDDGNTPVPWKKNRKDISSVVLPSGITSIGSYAFAGCSKITDITIPSSVTSIGGDAFGSCTNLTSITIPNSVTSIGDGAFYGCSSLTSITVPNSVISIGNLVFTGCSSLTSITIPNGVTSIGGSAFSGCSGLTSITIPNSVTSIGNTAFSSCSSLTSITIPNGVTSIDYRCFQNCTSLASVTIPKSVTNIDYSAFAGCSSLKSFTIPDSVTSIGSYAFAGCDNLASVIISDSVTSISSYAFKGCASLTSFTIPNKVKYINSGAFQDCTSLSSITIHDSVTTIQSYAFYGCTSLTSIIIPYSVTSIGWYAFNSCPNLRSVVLYRWATCSDAFKDYNGVFHYYYDVSYTNNENGKVSGKQRTFGTDEVEFTVTPNSNYAVDKVILTYADKTVEIIPDANGKFKYTMPDADSATISATFKSLIASGYCGAEGNGEKISWQLDSEGLLTISGTGKMNDWDSTPPWYENREDICSVVLSGNITSIGDFALYECGSLTSITIPDSVSSIGNDAFYGCSALTNVYYGNSEDKWKTINIGPNNESLLNANIKFAAANSITVNSGTSDLGKAAEGTTVTVTANVASLGKVFDKWVVVSGKVTLKDETQTTTTFTMPAENVEVTATYKDVEFTIKVNNGSANPATAIAGTVITLTAGAAPSGKVFDKWIVDSGTVSLSNASASTTTFTMPAENVEVTAIYKDIEYAIKVNNGDATHTTATAGTLVVLTAGDAPSGKVFDKWTVNAGSVSLSNALSSTTYFTMPAENVEITATYKTVPSGNFIVKVNNGVATPSTSAPGLVVNVKANDAPAGTEFEKWEVVSGTVIFADPSSATTFFVMPAANVEITAIYKSSLSVKGKTATVKYSKVKKKNQTLAVSKVLTFVDKGQGQLTYAKVSGNSKILINKTTGAITVKKKLKKKTYTVKVKVMASGNESCNPSGWKTVTFKIKVK